MVPGGWSTCAGSHRPGPLKAGPCRRCRWRCRWRSRPTRQTRRTRCIPSWMGRRSRRRWSRWARRCYRCGRRRPIGDVPAVGGSGAAVGTRRRRETFLTISPPVGERPPVPRVMRWPPRVTGRSPSAAPAVRRRPRRRPRGPAPAARRRSGPARRRIGCRSCRASSALAYRCRLTPALIDFRPGHAASRPPGDRSTREGGMPPELPNANVLAPGRPQGFAGPTRCATGTPGGCVLGRGRGSRRPDCDRPRSHWPKPV